MGKYFFIILSLCFFCCGISEKEQTCILVFTKTNGFKHESIPDGILALGKMAKENKWGITFTEDSTFFTSQNLDSYEAVVFLNTTLDVFGPKQEKAFEKYMHSGGGFVGIHAAADTEYEWDWYGKMLGARFKSHPEIQEATINVYKNMHPCVDHLGLHWTRTDEWYYFQDTLPSYCTPVLDLDENTIDSENEPKGLHSLSWYHKFGRRSRLLYRSGSHQSIISRSRFLKTSGRRNTLG